MQTGEKILIKTSSKEQFVGFFVIENKDIITIKGSTDGGMVFINKALVVEIVELDKINKMQPTRKATIKRYIGKREEVSKELLKLNNSLNQFSDVQIDLIRSFLAGLEGE